MKLIDTHCHFDVSDFDVDRQAVAERTLAAGVDTVLVPGYVAREWETLFRVCDSITAPRLLPAPGLHPCYVDEHEEAHLAGLEQWLRQRGDIVAVGEIGLDYFLPALKEEDAKRRQAIFFREQLRLATAFGKPVILHVRKAYHDVIRILHEMKFREGGIAHAFSGGIEEARHLVRLGFRLGIGGPLTYDQSRRLRSVVAEMPLSALVLETDAPDMIPRAHRAEGSRPGRNSSEFLPAVAQALAELKQVPLEEVIAVTRAESLAVLRIT